MGMLIFSRIEQHYTHLFQQMCADCGLDTDGGPLIETWDPNSSIVVEKMRGWLTRLRQTCLHPEVGAGNRRALGHGDGPLRTVGEGKRFASSRGLQFSHILSALKLT
jgi:E3 ubiquitin-protein ligase SHPRH